jgi:protease I
MKKAVLIIAEHDFQDIEFSHTKDELEKAGIQVVVASKSKGRKIGVLRTLAEATVSLKELRVDNYDAVVFIGGGGAEQYMNDKEAFKIIQDSVKKGKLIAAICIAPLILANAGILQNRKATVWDAGDGRTAAKLEMKGAKFINEDVVTDNNLITACGPGAARDFGRTIAKALLK